MDRQKRGVSAGTIVMVSVTVLVLALFAVLILPRLGSPREPKTASPASTVRATALPRATARPQTSAAPGVTSSPVRSFTLTAGGTVAMEPEVVKAGYYSEAKRYDFSDTLSLLADDMQADISLVTLENLVVPGAKVGKLIAPAEVMAMLKRGGVNTVALGFKRVWEQGTAAVESTRSAAQQQGLRCIGAFTDPADAAASAQIIEINGVRVAVLHFTQSVTGGSKNKLKKDGRSELLPMTAQAASEIRAARAAGAEVVIVSVHWGSEGNTSPTKAQQTLAQQMADAGADVIIGTGSRRVQSATWLTANRPDGSQGRTLCCYSLGCLISDSRDNGAVAGMLLHLTFQVTADGQVTISDASYTPTFVWRYSVASSNRYQVVSTLRAEPDAMNPDQRSAFAKARSRVENKLNGSPLRERIR